MCKTRCIRRCVNPIHIQFPFNTKLYPFVAAVLNWIFKIIKFWLGLAKDYWLIHSIGFNQVWMTPDSYSIFFCLLLFIADYIPLTVVLLSSISRTHKHIHPNLHLYCIKLGAIFKNGNTYKSGERYLTRWQSLTPDTREKRVLVIILKPTVLIIRIADWMS